MEFKMHRDLHNSSGNVAGTIDKVPDNINSANLEPRIVECRAIPPERIGINGEYDHDGLSKRVRLLLSEQLTNSVETLRISQRGRVVVIFGPWVTEEMAQRIINLCLQVEGATSVEVNGVCLASRSRLISHIEPNQYLLNAS
ncbi:MAG: hypothetical protein NT070_06815 [Cyanobacteria bacterium]|nr:hypothetical protein [Cyanobacteriota bacterium]